jgi:hypothetical protein
MDRDFFSRTLPDAGRREAKRSAPLKHFHFRDILDIIVRL